MAPERSDAENPAEVAPAAQYPPGPGRLRAVLVMGGLALVVGLLATRVETGEDDVVAHAGRIEVTARLLDCPEEFPDLGAYRYTYVLRYEVLTSAPSGSAG